MPSLLRLAFVVATLRGGIAFGVWRFGNPPLQDTVSLSAPSAGRSWSPWSTPAARLRYGPLVRVILYATLRAAIGARIVEFGAEIGAGSTVWDVVHALIARHPVLGPELLDGDGHLWPHVHVMVNGRDAPYLEHGLDTPLGADDTLDVFPPVGGG